MIDPDSIKIISIKSTQIFIKNDSLTPSTDWKYSGFINVAAGNIVEASTMCSADPNPIHIKSIESSCSNAISSIDAYLNLNRRGQTFVGMSRNDLIFYLALYCILDRSDAGLYIALIRYL